MNRTAAALIVLLIAAACSGGNDDASAVTSTGTTTVTTTTTPTSNSLSLLDRACNDVDAVLDMWGEVFTVSMELVGAEGSSSGGFGPGTALEMSGDDFRVAAERVLRLQTDLNPAGFASSAAGTQVPAGAVVLDDFLTDFADFFLVSAESADTGDLDLDKFGVESYDLILDMDEEIGTRLMGFSASSCP
jgi:hypothetical protein